jgi:hypothetical protein
MHLIDRYALSCGVSVGKPFIDEAYFPIAYDKYIVFQTSGKGNSRQYDYWSKVFAYIREYSQDYKIVHVGLPTDQNVLGCDLDLRGKTNIRNLAYLIKNSQLYLGVDSLSAHLAGFFNKKVVALYSYCYAQNCYPVWGDEKNKSILEVDWSVYGKPSFSLTDDKRKINTFKPEAIAKAVLDHLGVSNDLNKVETLSIGKLYHQPTIEIIPDTLPKNEIIRNKICNIRMDYVFNQENLIKIAEYCNLNIITNKEINLNILNRIKEKIFGFTFIVDLKTNPKYIEDLKSLGIKISLIIKNNDDWSVLSERFFDFGLEKEEVIGKSSVKNIDKINENCIFTSEKVILSRGKVYSNKLFWEKDMPKFEKQAPVIDHPSFWEESEHFHIIKDERPKRIQ